MKESLDKKRCERVQSIQQGLPKVENLLVHVRILYRPNAVRQDY